VKRPVALLVLGLCTALSALTWTQTTGDRIDYYFSDWHSSARRTTHGSLPQQDILTRDDRHESNPEGWSSPLPIHTPTRLWRDTM
jgi:hypothetical protein